MREMLGPDSVRKLSLGNSKECFPVPEASLGQHAAFLPDRNSDTRSERFTAGHGSQFSLDLASVTPPVCESTAEYRDLTLTGSGPMIQVIQDTGGGSPAWASVREPPRWGSFILGIVLCHIHGLFRHRGGG